MKTHLDKGSLKTITFSPDAASAFCAQIKCGHETYNAVTVEIAGEGNIYFDGNSAVMETYDVVVFDDTQNPLKVFILFGYTKAAVVSAIDEKSARLMHPEGYTWAPRKKAWKHGQKYVDMSTHHWPSPEEVFVQKGHQDEDFGVLPEVLYTFDLEVPAKPK